MLATCIGGHSPRESAMAMTIAVTPVPGNKVIVVEPSRNISALGSNRLDRIDDSFRIDEKKQRLRQDKLQSSPSSSLYWEKAQAAYYKSLLSIAMDNNQKFCLIYFIQSLGTSTEET
jgi:hypothetical protein